MAGDEPFSVQLEWPGKQFLPEGCEMPEVRFILLVARRDDPRGFRADSAPKSHVLHSNARVDMPGGAGDYLVYASTDFDLPGIDDVVVNTYAAEAVEIKSSSA